MKYRGTLTQMRTLQENAEQIEEWIGQGRAESWIYREMGVSMATWYKFKKEALCRDVG